jgi:DNA-binding NarL/FixJ family response regulator
MVNNVKPLRILIADDHDIFRHGVRQLIQSHPGWEICGEASMGLEAIAQAKELLPDIAILDIGMPDMDGLEAASKIGTVSPNTEILILSAHYSDQLIREIVNAGIRGYILKSDSDRDLVIAVENLANHQAFFTRYATEMIHSTFSLGQRLTKTPQSLGDRLTTREREVVKLLSGGMKSKKVASMLGISIKTVETHRSNAMRKLDLHNMNELVRYAVRNQIIEP